MEKVYIYIQSYDCIEHIRNIIEDVLKQTYKNWVCLIYDNESTDGTWDIVKEYADVDDRFVVKRCSKQIGLMMRNAIPDVFLMSNIKEDFFLCIDADDRIEPDYVEKMLNYKKENNVELVCCGCDFISAESGNVFGKRTLQRDIILAGEQFSTLFSQYHPFTRTHWGKLYPISLLKRMRIQTSLEIAYGIDTLFAQEAFLKASTVGIMKECLYHYYMYNGVKTYDLREGRYESPAILLDRVIDYLGLKTGMISKENHLFLYGLYEKETRDAVRTLMIADVGDDRKSEILYKIIKSHHTRTLLEYAGRSSWMYEVARVCIELYMKMDKDYREMLAECLAIMRLCPTNVEGMEKGVLFELCVRMHKYWIDIPNEPSLYDYAKMLVVEEPLLKEMDSRVLFICDDVVYAICEKNYVRANKLTRMYMESKAICNPLHRKQMGILFKNLSAMVSDEEGFTQAVKYVIDSMIKLGEYELAAEELEDWNAILPHDEDFMKLRDSLML